MERVAPQSPRAGQVRSAPCGPGLVPLPGSGPAERSSRRPSPRGAGGRAVRVQPLWVGFGTQGPAGGCARPERAGLGQPGRPIPAARGVGQVSAPGGVLLSESKAGSARRPRVRRRRLGQSQRSLSHARPACVGPVGPASARDTHAVWVHRGARSVREGDAARSAALRCWGATLGPTPDHFWLYIRGRH